MPIILELIAVRTQKKTKLKHYVQDVTLLTSKKFQNHIKAQWLTEEDYFSHEEKTVEYTVSRIQCWL